MSVDGTAAKPSVDSGRLVALVEHLSEGVLMETADRRVAHINQAFCDLFLIPAPPEALLGGDCVEAARSLGPLLGDVDPFLARVDELIDAWATVVGEHIPLTDGRLLERDFLPVTHSDGTREVAWVYRDVTEWENRHVAATDEAQQYADLLSAISHDVRTPVTGIVGLVELLRTQPIDERTRQMVDSVRQSAASLTTMLDDFMDAARADAGRLDIRAEEANPESLLESVTDMVAPIARAKGLLLQSAVAPEVPAAVRLDIGRVRQVLLNLVSNAVKFASAGHVLLIATVRQDSDGDRLVVACEDTGPGLGDLSPDEVFTAFVQGPQEGRRTATGAGLGLSIASRLAAAMGGSLAVAETGVTGSTFRFELPLVAVPEAVTDKELDVVRVGVVGPEAAAAAAALTLTRHGATIDPVDPQVVVVVGGPVPDDVSQRCVILAAREPFRTPVADRGTLAAPVSARDLCAAVLDVDVASLTGGPLPPLSRELRVLVVEDDDTNRTLITRMVEVLGAVAVAAPDGVEALGLATTDHFDLILMDIHLPGIDGVQTAAAVHQRRKEGNQAPIPIVSMTGSTGWNQPVEDAQFSGSLPKPMTLAQLHALLMSVGAGPAALDLSTLARLVADLGDAELVADTVQTYLDELPARVRTLAQACGAGDATGAKEAAHGLKSTSAMLGAARMAELCQELESTAGSMAAAEVATELNAAAIQREAERVSAAMTDYLAGPVT